MIFFLFLAYLSIFGSACYAAASLSLPFLWLSLAGAFGATWWHVRGTLPPLRLRVFRLAFDRSLFFPLGVITSVIGFFHVVFSTAITTAVRTPWAVFSPGNIVWLAAGFFCLVMSRRFRAVGIFLLAGAALSLAALVYPLGFGFDPFIHRAAVEYIAQHGVITPKTPYYIGQYVIELVAMRVFHLPLRAFDALLVPLLMAGVLAWGAWCEKFAHGTVFALALLPLGAFVQTTPQALAFVFTLLAIFSGHSRNVSRVRPDPFFIFSLAALACHPIAGIPAMLFSTLTFFERVSWRHLRALRGLLFTFGSVAVPGAFLALSVATGQDVGFSWGNALDASRLPVTTFFSTRFDAFLDVAYLVIDNLWLILLALSAYGVVIAAKRGLWATYRPGILTAGICAANFFLLALLFDFPFLPAYERADFAVRLLILAELFLLPTAALALEHIAHGVRRLGALPHLFFATILTLAFCANVYGAYPRHDAVARSGAFNVSAADVSTVQRIERELGAHDYIVLADQTLSAAAMQEFGFVHYYRDDVFYYPIPTGGPLAMIFLDMIERGPTLAKVTQARELSGVDTVAFAVHTYWWNSANTIENAKAIASAFFCSDDTSVCVFSFFKP